MPSFPLFLSTRSLSSTYEIHSFPGRQSGKRLVETMEPSAGLEANNNEPVSEGMTVINCISIWIQIDAPIEIEITQF